LPDRKEAIVCVSKRQYQLDYNLTKGELFVKLIKQSNQDRNGSLSYGHQTIYACGGLARLTHAEGES
jgi:hypothetical protein